MTCPADGAPGTVASLAHETIKGLRKDVVAKCHSATSRTSAGFEMQKAVSDDVEREGLDIALHGEAVQ